MFTLVVFAIHIYKLTWFVSAHLKRSTDSESYVRPSGVSLSAYSTLQKIQLQTSVYFIYLFANKKLKSVACICIQHLLSLYSRISHIKCTN